MKTSSLNVGFCYDAQGVDLVLVDQWGVYFFWTLLWILIFSKGWDFKYWVSGI
jgi:hypothetical protein